MKATFKMPQNKLSASFSMGGGLDPRKYATKAELQIETDNRISGDNQLGNRINLVEEDILNLSATVNNNYTVLDNKFTSIYETIINYGDIVSYNATDFATANQGALADTALQPNDNISELVNNAGYITMSALSGYATENFVTNQGYITGITSNDVTTALGYIPYNSTNPNGYITASALNGYATETWVTNQGYITGITSSDVTTALGYIPYNSTNPNGYTSNTGTVTSVNNISPVSGNVTLNIPTDTSDLTNGAGYITSASLANYQTTSNLVTSISSSSTNAQYPSAKCVYDIVGNIESILQNINSGS